MFKAAFIYLEHLLSLNTLALRSLQPTRLKEVVEHHCPERKPGTDEHGPARSCGLGGEAVGSETLKVRPCS